MEDRPEWVTKYRLLGLPKGWADPALEKHNKSFIDSISKEISPIRNTSINITNLKDSPIDEIPSPPEDHTKIEVLLLLMDLLDCLSSSIPTKDRDIYSMYEDAIDSPLFKLDSEFPDFYKFCREIQYTDIREINYYKLIDEAFKKYVLRSADPEKGSIWEIPYENGVYKVKVKGKVPIVNERIADPEIHCEIIETVDDKGSVVEEGTLTTIPPKSFNEGRPIKKTI